MPHVAARGTPPTILPGMWRDESPFFDVRSRFPWLTPMEIAKLCYDFARELRWKGVNRSPAKRLELALNVSAILSRVAERITGEHQGGSYTPERERIKNGALVSAAFAEFVEKEWRLLADTPRSERQSWCSGSAELLYEFPTFKPSSA